MYNCEIEIANLGLDWRFPYMASQLPAPGTEAFDFIVKSLREFGLTARSISIETPTSNLDDVGIAINLPNPKLGLRITYSGIEAEARDVTEEGVIQILQILNSVSDGVGKVVSDLKQGSGNVRVSLHIKLIEGSADEYLSERVSAKINNQNVKPEALVFSLDFDEITKNFPTRITIAKSIAVNNGLFLEINYQSGTSAQDFEIKEPMEFFSKLADHTQTILSVLELSLVKEEANS